MNSISPSTVQPPLIREKLRLEAELAAEVGRKLTERGFAPPGADPLKDALVHVFARYCDVLIERLNHVPQSYHEAFLRMLGATPAPAIPARVPLSFTPVKSTQNFTPIVPQSTQVSAPAEDQSDPLVIFETTKDLPLVRAEFKRAVAVDACRLLYSDVSSIFSLSAQAGAARTPAEPLPMVEAKPLERILYITQPAVIGVPKLTRLRVKLELDNPASMPSGWRIEWGIPSGTVFLPLIPESDSTANLTRNGELVFIPPEKWPSPTIASETMPWLACRLYPAAASRLPPDQNREYTALIQRIEVSGDRSLDAVPPAGAFNNGIPLDVSRDFFPLGERPRFGDVFYVFSEIFAAPGTKVVLDIKLTNPSGAIDSPIPPVSKKGNPKLRWEGHTSRGWVPVDCTDGSLSLTQDGLIEFHVPADATPAMINGVNGGWIRARLIGGNYSPDETVTAPFGLPPINPPAIAAMQVTSIQQFGPLPPERLIVESDLIYRKIDPALPFNPFPAPAEKGLMLYLALSSPRGDSELNGKMLSLYSFFYEGARHVVRSDDASPNVSGMPSWQAHTISGWSGCKVNDSTRGLRSPGIVEVHTPDGMSRWHDSVLDPDQQFFWLRIVWQPADVDQLPHPFSLVPQRLLLNTVLASQTLKLTDELLGSSNGRPRQILYTLHKPIIGTPTLQVREPIVKTKEQEDQGLEAAHSHSGAIAIRRAQANEDWIGWAEVADFSNSDSRSRHYILDRLTGSVRFGDGINGDIPPSGANNIRMHEYHTGGGQRGNRPPATVTQFHTTIPYIESVTNHQPAAGGQDQENFESLNRGAATLLRHRDRAVSIGDYADLAVRASPEVARAKCVSACDVSIGAGNPLTEAKLGSVCVMVVPKAGEEDKCPQPSFELLKNVKEYLDRRRPVGIELTLLGPEYVNVRITAELAWAPDRSTATLVAGIEKRLNAFLHPTTGGPTGSGWQFGEQPHALDFYPLLGEFEGLDYVRSLELHFEEGRPGLLDSGVFLICPGKHEIRLC